MTDTPAGNPSPDPLPRCRRLFKYCSPAFEAECQEWAINHWRKYQDEDLRENVVTTLKAWLSRRGITTLPPLLNSATDNEDPAPGGNVAAPDSENTRRQKMQILRTLKRRRFTAHRYRNPTTSKIQTMLRATPAAPTIQHDPPVAHTSNAQPREMQHGTHSETPPSPTIYDWDNAIEPGIRAPSRPPQPAPASQTTQHTHQDTRSATVQSNETLVRTHPETPPSPTIYHWDNLPASGVLNEGEIDPASASAQSQQVPNTQVIDELLRAASSATPLAATEPRSVRVRIPQPDPIRWTDEDRRPPEPEQPDDGTSSESTVALLSQAEEEYQQEEESPAPSDDELQQSRLRRHPVIPSPPPCTFQSPAAIRNVDFMRVLLAPIPLLPYVPKQWRETWARANTTSNYLPVDSQCGSGIRRIP